MGTNSGSQLPKVKVETKFMQNYRIGSSLNPGKQLLSVAKPNGDIELFTIGTDNYLWNYYPDKSSETGYSGERLIAAQPDSFASVGCDSEGRIVVFITSSSGYTGNCTAIGYFYEINQETSRWSDVSVLNINPCAATTGIAGMYSQRIAGQLYISILFESMIGQYSPLLYKFSWSQFNPENPTFTYSPCTFYSTNCVWIGDTAEEAAFACIDPGVMSYNVSTGQIENYPCTGNSLSYSVDTAIDKFGSNQIFSVQIDRNLYRLEQASSGSWTWNQLGTIGGLKQVRVAPDEDGNIQAFCISQDNSLYHWKSHTKSSAPIYTSASQVTLAYNDVNNLTLFLTGTAQNSLINFYQEIDSSNWVGQSLQAATGDVVEYNSYTTDVTLYDAAGAILPNETVLLSAAEKSTLNISGEVYSLTSDNKISITTNGAGMISLAQETGSLAIPTIEINIPDLMSSDQSITIEQSADVQNRLATVDADGVMDAVDSSGQYLLSGEYRTQENADSIAKACNNCMELIGEPEASNDAAGFGIALHNPEKRGVRLRSGGIPGDLLLLRGKPTHQHWKISFNGSNVVYQELSAEEARLLFENAKADSLSKKRFAHWFEDIGDLLRGVTEGVISVVDCVVTTIKDKFCSAIHFVYKGVTYVLDKVIHFVEQAFDLVETIWAQVKVAFQKLFEWLGFIFDWNDILRTHEAMKYTINQMMGFLGGAATGIQSFVDNGIDSFQSQIDTLFKELLPNISDQTIGGYTSSSQPPDPYFESTTSNNIVYNNFVDHAGSALPNGIPTISTNFDHIMETITDIVSSTETTSAFVAAQSYFTNLGSQPDQIFSNTIAGLMSVVEGLVQAAINGCQAAVDALFGAVQDFIVILQDSLNETWDIPFVTQFYHWLTGSDLSTLDLISLILAIPSTVLYKISTNESPFPDEASVDAFEASFNAQTMLQAAGFAPKSDGIAPAAQSNGGILSDKAALLLAYGTCTSKLCYGWLTAICDIVPEKNVPKALSITTFVCEFTAQALSFPWFTSSGSIGCTSPEGWDRVIWAVGCSEVLVDLLYIDTKKAIPENSDDTGVIIATILGGIHLTMAIGASVGRDAIYWANNLIPTVPELFKFLLISDIVASTEYISKMVCSGIDALFYTTGAIIEFSINSGESDALLVAAPTAI